MNYRLLALGFLCTLTACGSDPLPPVTNVIEEEVGENSEIVYADYASGLLGRGKSAVLFFFTPSDPLSMKNDALLRKAYEAGTAVVSTYRVDFHSSTGARLTYGVLVENTFVLVDSTGVGVKNFIHPTPEEINIFLRGNIPASPQS